MKSDWEIPVMKAGVATGVVARKLLKYAEAEGFASPASTCTGSLVCNSLLEGAAKVGVLAYIQFSEGCSAFFWETVQNDKKQAPILGACAGAHCARIVALAYGIPVLVHSDQCAKRLLPAFGGVLEADAEEFRQHARRVSARTCCIRPSGPTRRKRGFRVEHLKKMAPTPRHGCDTTSPAGPLASARRAPLAMKPS